MLSKLTVLSGWSSMSYQSLQESLVRGNGKGLIEDRLNL